MHSELQVMASHALTVYRGFEQTGPNAYVEQTLYNLVGRTLRELPTLRGDWTLTWGPATYRPLFALVGTTAAYVAQHQRHPGRLVISVRGTNPLSAFDFVFGDLWVDRFVPWKHGTAPAGAAISASTSLGLQTLLQLRAQTREASGFLRGWGELTAALRDRAMTMATEALMPVTERLSAPLRALRSELDEALDSLPLAPDADWETHVQQLTARYGSQARRRTLALLNDAEETVTAEMEFDLLRFLEGGDHLRALLDRGDSLVEHLEELLARIPRDEPIEVFVVGHSKGGALASTLALWLQDHQGQADGWDPELRARVHCYSFAGPTAGNVEFATYSDRQLGSRCHRVYNPLDMVTRAWAPEDLPAVPALYAPVVEHSPALADLAAFVLGDLDDLGSAYRHVGLEPVRIEAAPLEDESMFAAQVVHHHLDAYLEGLGLSDEMDTFTFFGGG